MAWPPRVQLSSDYATRRQTVLEPLNVRWLPERDRLGRPRRNETGLHGAGWAGGILSAVRGAPAGVDFTFPTHIVTALAGAQPQVRSRLEFDGQRVNLRGKDEVIF